MTRDRYSGLRERRAGGRWTRWKTWPLSQQSLKEGLLFRRIAWDNLRRQLSSDFPALTATLTAFGHGRSAYLASCAHENKIHFIYVLEVQYGCLAIKISNQTKYFGTKTIFHAYHALIIFPCFLPRGKIQHTSEMYKKIQDSKDILLFTARL